MDQLVRDFLERYERANSAGDVAAIGRLYADTFLFGGPAGVRALPKDDFLRVIPKMKAQLASMGLGETRLQSVEASAMDSRYLMAKAHWTMAVRGSSGETHAVSAFATYILEQTPDTLTIVFQIDHQDLASVLRSPQNTPKSSGAN